MSWSVPDAVRRLFATCLVAVVMGGCIAVPSGEGAGVVSGQPVPRDEISPTATEKPTRDDFRSRFGPPTLEFEDLRVVAYAWSEHQRDWTVYGVGGTWIPDVWKHEIQNREYPVLFARFDADGRLETVSLESQDRDVSLRSQATRWLKRQRLEVPSEPRGVSREAGIPGMGILYVVAGPALPRFTGIAPNMYRCQLMTVEVDSQPVGELQAGTALVVPVAPGDHEVRVEPWPAYRYTPAERVDRSRRYAAGTTLERLSVPANDATYLEATCQLSGKTSLGGELAPKAAELGLVPQLVQMQLVPLDPATASERLNAARPAY